TFTTIRLSYVLQILALAALLWLSSREALLLSLLVLGLGFASADTMLAKAVPEVVGMRALGAILGVLNLGWRFRPPPFPLLPRLLYDLTVARTIPFAGA